MNNNSSYKILTDFLWLLKLLIRSEELIGKSKDRTRYVQRRAIDKAVKAMNKMVPGMDWHNRKHATHFRTENDT